MKELFAVPRMRRDGSLSKLSDIPDVDILQTDPEHRDNFIRYSAKDAMATWWLYNELGQLLRNKPWMVDNKCIGTMLDFNDKYLVPFGECLTVMVSC